MGNAIYFKYFLLSSLRLMERHWIIREVYGPQSVRFMVLSSQVYGPQIENLIVLMNPEFYIIKRYLNLR